MQLFVESDVEAGVLRGEKIAVLGYGSQGRAHAMNLRDSGYDVVIGLRPDGKTTPKAQRDGFTVKAPAEAVKGVGLVAFLAPDLAQGQLYKDVESNLKKSATLLFAHGFNILYKLIQPRADLDVVLIAPKGPGDLVRRQYEQGRGGVLATTFREETETDLFGEQAVLCGGATELIVRGFETLVEAGYQPEVAYFECMHEMKLIVDLLHEGGLKKMHQFVSDTAKYGDLTRGPRIIDQHVRDNMKQVLKEVQDGTFAKEWVEENKTGQKNYKRLMQEDLDQRIEKVGKALRGRMSWLQE